ncbi:AhpD-like protein [Apiospora rasikravindrae]|uniref:AhpD-like protein n=1 Tax=Apiospora rasikravindrae TaxID=990691 RepID=A0ABR1SMR6_9PEZI
MSHKFAPSVITSTVLANLRNHPNLPNHCWYLVAATTLAVLNQPHGIRDVYKYEVEQCGNVESLAVLRRMREALIKASAVGGVPKTINALLSLKEVTPAELLEEPGTPSLTERQRDIYETPPAEILGRGQTFFDKIYGRISRRIMGQLDKSGTQDLGLTARLVYGYLLSNTRVLSTTETSFVLIAGLIPQDVNPQLKGHLRGALNNGATVEEVRAIRAIAVTICEAFGMERLADGVVGGWGWRDEVANV